MSDHGTPSRYSGDGRHPPCRCPACRDANATAERVRAAKAEARPVGDPRKLRRMLAPEAWQADAACRGTDPNLFHPNDTSPNAIKAAKAVCAECPVRKDCLDFAMRNREECGVWGGLTPDERRSRRRRLQRRQRRLLDMLREAS